MMSLTKTSARWLALVVLATGVAAFAERGRVANEHPASANAGEASASASGAAPVPAWVPMKSLSVSPVMDGGGAVTAAAPPALAARRRMHSLTVSEPMRDTGQRVAAIDGADVGPSVNGSSPIGVGSVAAGSVPDTDGAAAPKGLPISVVQTGSGAQGRQSLALRGSTGAFSQRQEGGGNSQILNVESAAGGAVNQRQSGSGNFQSMNIGVTDQRPGAVSGISIE